MTKIVFVKGNIIADSGYHLAKNFECLARIEDKDSADIVIEGDIHLNEENTLIPYYFYKASAGITATDGDIGCFTNPYLLREELSEELEKIVLLSKKDYKSELQQIELKSLFGSVFGCFEAFITMFLTNMILGDKDYYERFLLYINAANYKEKNVIEKIVREINNFTSHNLKNVKNIFENIFEIDFPDYTYLKDFIKRRHDIIHRSGRKIVGNHVEKIYLTCNEIDDLVTQCNNFVDKLMVAMGKPIRKWED